MNLINRIVERNNALWVLLDCTRSDDDRLAALEVAFAIDRSAVDQGEPA